MAMVILKRYKISSADDAGGLPDFRSKRSYNQSQRNLLHLRPRPAGQFKIEGLNEAEIDHLNRAWHRLSPWPDAVRGLNRLRARYVLATLSNGNISLLVNMAKNAGLPWDCELSAENSGHYKPDPEAYLMAARLLSLRPEEVMMVAAHGGDLQAARKVGFKTAFIPRPLEHGPDAPAETVAAAEVDIVAADFIELAEKLRT